MRWLLPAALLLTGASAQAGSSNSLIDITPDGKRLIVANTDAGTVSIVDVKSRKLLHEIAVGDHPEGVSWVGNGPTALVTAWGDDKLIFLDADAGKAVHTLAVDDEPYGVVVTADEKRAFITHDYPGTVAEVDVVARKVLRTFPAGPYARGIALAPDEKTLYVTEFYSARLNALDRDTGKQIRTWKPEGAENLCRNVALHPTLAKAYLPHIRSRVDSFSSNGSIFSNITVCDLNATPPARRDHSTDSLNANARLANPWEIAASPDGTRVYVIYAGTDDINVFKPLDDSYRDLSAIGRPIPLRGRHPQAIRVSPDNSEIYIYHAVDSAIAIYTADVRRQLVKIAVGTPPHTPEWRRGKELFVSAHEPMGADRWMSCSSCHPNGLTDHRVWHNPEGDRRTVNFFGLAHTHPIHWSADRDEVQDFEHTIRGKLMRGNGLMKGSLKAREGFLPGAELEQELAGKSADLDALAVYTNSFEPRPSPHAVSPGMLTPSALRGKELFFSAAVGCAVCHSGPYFTDSSLKKPFVLHDVGTGNDPREKMGPKYDTPTLISVYRTGPYLHDGRALTLRDVLTTHNAGDRHGKTSHLAPAAIDDLVAFMKSLPYEPLPAHTPNSVRHHLKAPKAASP